MEKLNIIELLRDCPTGMELDCTMFEDVHFDHISDCGKFIFCYINYEDRKTSISFNKYGAYSNSDKSKCVIFPKGKKTWEGFHRPFEDGDIIYTKHKLGTEFISIFQIEYERDICTYWDINLSTNKLIGNLHEGNAFKVFIEKDKVKEQRFATEEEKEKLFKAIKDNGYQWNTETKTLKLIEPIFKVGNKIRHKDDKTAITITGIKDNYYFIQFYNIRKNEYQNEKLSFTDQDKYELVIDKFDINILNPFKSEVLVRTENSDIWEGDIFVRYDKNATVNKFHCIGGWYEKCIPFKGNDWLLGTADDCNNYYKTWKE